MSLANIEVPDPIKLYSLLIDDLYGCFSFRKSDPRPKEPVGPPSLFILHYAPVHYIDTPPKLDDLSRNIPHGPFIERGFPVLGGFQFRPLKDVCSNLSSFEFSEEVPNSGGCIREIFTEWDRQRGAGTYLRADKFLRGYHPLYSR